MKINGLTVFNNFLSPNQYKNIQKYAFNLHKKIIDKAANYNSHHTSLNHNLKTHEKYQQLILDDNTNNNKKLNAQHFQTYHEKRHKLTYFKGNQNIPFFFMDSLIPQILQSNDKNNIIECNFTFNTYAQTNSKFDFHKDIESNGDFTAIYSIGTSSEFQIRHPDKITDIMKIPMLSNSLFLLSDEARWDYEHSVINKTDIISDEEQIIRMSLVFGFK